MHSICMVWALQMAEALAEYVNAHVFHELGGMVGSIVDIVGATGYSRFHKDHEVVFRLLLSSYRFRFRTTLTEAYQLGTNSLLTW
jgi:hypothetical protein